MIKLLFILISTSIYLNAIILSKEESEFLKKHPKIILGSDPSWYPYVYKNNENKIIGYNVDIINKINEITGANFQFQVDNWQKTVNKAKRREIDGITPSIGHEERRLFFNFTNPISKYEVKIIVKHGNPLNIKSIKNLSNKTIAIQKGNLFLEKLAKEFTKMKILYTDTLEESYYQVIYGKADFTINQPTLKHLQNEYGLPHLNIAFKLEKKANLVISIRKDWPEAISILNKGLNAIPKSTRNALEKKWCDKYHLNDTSVPNYLNLSKTENEYIKNKKNIKVCVDASWYPFNYFGYTNSNKLILKLSKKVLDRLGLEQTIVSTKNWKDSLEHIKNKQCDLISAIYPSEKRAEYINFTSSYVNYPLMLLTRKDSPYLFNLKRLSNKKIAVINESAVKDIFDELYPNNNFIYVKNILEGFNEVEKGRAYAYIDLLPALIPILKPIKSYNLKINRSLEVDIPLSIGLRNDDKILLSIIEKSLANIPLIEKFEVLNKFVEKEKKKIINAEFVIKILIIILIILLLFIYWNIQLKKSVKSALIKNKDQKGLLYHYSKQDAMKDLVGNISHQWKQPINELSSIIFFIETKLYLGEKVSQEEIRNSMIKTREIINYLSRTVSVFSNFYNPKKSKNNVYILALLKQAIFITEGSFQRYKIEINLDIKEKNLTVKGEELQQVILSIINNVKNIVIERKILHPIINIKLYKENNNSILEVEDNCGGIDNIEDNIFELYTTSTKSGTGLGLYISKRIIEDKYKGTISVKNTEKGALFKITIPIKKKV